MKQSIKELIEICAKTLELPEPIYEFGSLQVKGQEEFADLRTFFSDKKYIGTDMRKGPGVDKIINLHNINLPNNTVGTALLLETLEHVEYPHRAMDEVYRVLKKNGVVIITSVMNFPIHNHPSDYWRFTPEAFKSLLKPSKTIFVNFAGFNDFPHTIIGLGFNKEKVRLNKFKSKFRLWKNKWWNQSGKFRITWAELFGSPIVVNLYKKLIKSEDKL